MIGHGRLVMAQDVKVPTLNEDGEAAVPARADPDLVAPAEECSICLNSDMERPCKTPCQHWFCRYTLTLAHSWLDCPA